MPSAQHTSPPRTSPPRTSYHHGNLREALVDAALELTRTGGESALVLRDVTRRVGVSPNAAYRHFADREALAGAVAERIQQRMAEMMRSFETPVPSGTSSARNRLIAVGLGYIDFALTEPGWFEVAFGGPEALPEDAATAPVPEPLALLIAALDGLVDAGELSPAARAGAEWPCWSTVHGFALLALTGPLRRVPADTVWDAARRAVDTVVSGLLV